MIGRRVPSPLIHLLALVLLSACGSEPDRQSSIIALSDSAGIQIVEYDLEDDAPRHALALQPEVSFATEVEAFNIVRSFSRADDGRYLILDDVGGVRVFDSTGALIARVGRYGQGPAEVQMPWDAWWRDDGGIVIYDAMGSAMLSFSRDYVFQDRLAVHHRFAHDVLPLAGGRVLFTRNHSDSATIGYTQDYNSIHVVGPRGDSTTWSRTVAGDGRQTPDPSEPRGGTLACPYKHETPITTHDSIVIAGQRAARPSLLIASVDGEARRILRRPGSAVPPSDEQVAFSIAEFRYHVVESGWEGYDPSNCDMPSVAEVSRILPSPDGHLWMARERSFPAFETRAWDLVSLTGEHRRALSVHPHFRVLEFGDGDVLGVLTTEVGEVLPLVFAIEAP